VAAPSALVPALEMAHTEAATLPTGGGRVSASEKLRALEDAIERRVDDNDVTGALVEQAKVIVALHEIVAVVEAAEDGYDDGHGAWCCLCGNLLWRDGHRKDCPITALDEKLP
jgi:hypothetical protein